MAITAGVMLAGAALKAYGGRRESERAARYAKMQRQVGFQLASPKHFKEQYAQYGDIFKGQYMPQYRKFGEVMGYRQATGDRAINRRFGRRGNTAGGMREAALGANRAVTTGGMSNAYQDMVSRYLGQAAQQANTGIDRQLSVNYKGRPVAKSRWGGVGGVLQQGAGMYSKMKGLTGGGGGGSPGASWGGSGGMGVPGPNNTWRM